MIIYSLYRRYAVCCVAMWILTRSTIIKSDNRVNVRVYDELENIMLLHCNLLPNTHTNCCHIHYTGGVYATTTIPLLLLNIFSSPLISSVTHIIIR